MSGNINASRKASTCKINVSDLPWMIAYLRVVYIEPYPIFKNSKILAPYFKVLSRYFESWEIVNHKKEEVLCKTYYKRLNENFYEKKKGKNLLPVILLAHRNRTSEEILYAIPGTDSVIAIFQGMPSEEKNLFFFTIWKKTHEDKLSLVKVLDKIVEVGWGEISIKEILKLSENDLLIIGLSDSSEGGQGWGNLWIGVLESFNTLKIYNLSSISFFSELKTLPNGKEVFVEQNLSYQLDRKKFLIEIILNQRTTEVSGEIIKDWHTIKRKEIDLKQILAKIKSTKTYE